MSRFNKIILLVFLFLVAFLTYLEAIEPEPVNWNPSYSGTDKIPLGTYVLYDHLKSHYHKIENVNQPAFEFLSNNDPKGTYIFINNHLPFDDAELKILLGWVEKGNYLFAASDAFSKNLLDTLGLNIGTKVPDIDMKSKPMVNLVNPDFKAAEAYLYDKETYHSVFIEVDTLQHTVLGVSQLYSANRTIEEPEVNFVQVPYGKGEIFLHTTPQVFSNYFILEGKNADYVEKTLAYLPTEGTLYWDEYEKAGKVFNTSLLYVLMEKKALKWAYYFLLAGAILFILFEGKRKQRSIPVVKQLENQTYNFTRTIAGLYLDRKDFSTIAKKKIGHFLEYIRAHYRISTADMNEDFYFQVSVQSERSIEEVKAVFQLMENIKQQNNTTKKELQALNTAIESLKNK